MPLQSRPSSPLPPDLAKLSKEERLKLAVEALNRAKETGRKLSLRDAARAYDVPHSTLSDRMRGVQTRRDAHAAQMALTDAGQ